MEVSIQTIIILSILLLSGFYIKNRLRRNEKKVIKNVKKTVLKKPIFSHVKETKRLIKRSEESFEKKEYKKAYSLIGRALRIYLIYENGLSKELTNDELINYLKNHKKNYSLIKQYLNTCSLVSFAKNEVNKKEFLEIVKHAKKLVNKSN